MHGHFWPGEAKMTGWLTAAPLGYGFDFTPNPIDSLAFSSDDLPLVRHHNVLFLLLHAIESIRPMCHTTINY